MLNFDELIEYENESTRLDFKRVQYVKHFYEALLKDVLSMANANLIDDRYIVVGVEHRADGTREFCGIPENEFVDSATYHQLIRENIEPEVHFDYQPYRFGGVLLGVFRIHSTADQPYMMRKQYGQTLRAGDAFIRKGTHQTRLLRSDLDRMFQSREAKESAGPVEIGFDIGGMPTDFSLPALGNLELPSARAAAKIRAILAERERAAQNPSLASFGHRVIGAGALGLAYQDTSYAQRSSEQLRIDLQSVEETYHGNDMHEMFELKATKLNLRVKNAGTSYIEDASIRVIVPKVEGFKIADQVYHKPQDNLGMPGYNLAGLLGGPVYPRVVEDENSFIISANIGNLRHGIPAKAFDQPIRVLARRSLVGRKLNFECTLYGKQLRAPQRSTLTVEITCPEG